jgi:hypothetical protein
MIDVAWIICVVQEGSREFRQCTLRHKVRKEKGFHLKWTNASPGTMCLLFWSDKLGIAYNMLDKRGAINVTIIKA